MFEADGKKLSDLLNSIGKKETTLCVQKKSAAPTSTVRECMDKIVQHQLL